MNPGFETSVGGVCGPENGSGSGAVPDPGVLNLSATPKATGSTSSSRALAAANPGF